MPIYPIYSLTFFPLNQLSLGFGTTNIIIPVERNPLSLESFVINVDGQEVILTLANKSQLGQDTDMEQSLHDSNTSVTDKGLHFGQQTSANLGSWVRITQWKEKRLIYFEGFSHKLATNLLYLLRSHHTPLSMLLKHHKARKVNNSDMWMDIQTHCS